MDPDRTRQQDEGALPRRRRPGLPHHHHASSSPAPAFPSTRTRILEQTYIIEGSLVDAEGACTAGNFVVRAKGSRHSPVAPNGCTMLVFFMKPTASLARALLKQQS